MVGVGGCFAQRHIEFEGGQLVARVAHRLERRRVFLVFLGEDVVGGEPVLESHVLRDGKGVGAHPGQQDGHAPRGLVAQEVLDALDADDVRVAYAFEPQDHKLDVLGLDPLS